MCIWIVFATKKKKEYKHTHKRTVVVVFICKCPARVQIDRQIPQRQKDLAAPFLPGATLVRQAEGLGMVGGQDHSLADLLSQKDCWSHKEELPLGWINISRHISLIILFFAKLFEHMCFFCIPVDPSEKCETNTSMLLPLEMCPSRNLYWPDALWFRWKVVGWQQVSWGDTWILMGTVRPLRPQHPLQVLHHKHTSCNSNYSKHDHALVIQFIQAICDYFTSLTFSLQYLNLSAKCKPPVPTQCCKYYGEFKFISSNLFKVCLSTARVLFSFIYFVFIYSHRFHLWKTRKLKENKKQKQKTCNWFSLPLCNPDGCPRGRQRDPGPQTRWGGAGGWLPSGLSCALTQVPHWMPLTPLLQTTNKDRNTKQNKVLHK